MISELAAFVKPLLDKIHRGESISEFHQGIVFTYLYFSTQPAQIEDVSEVYNVRNLNTPRQSTFFDDPIFGFSQPATPNPDAWDGVPGILASESASHVRFQFPPQISEITEDPDPNRQTVNRIPTAPEQFTTRIAGRLINYPYLTKLRENETIQIRRLPSLPPVRTLTVTYNRGNLAGFYCAEDDILYKNMSVACKAIWSRGAKRSAHVSFVERNGHWVTLHSLN